MVSQKDVAEATIKSQTNSAKFEFMQSSLKQLIKAAEAFPVAIFMADAEGRIVLVNSKTETMFGYQGDELIGQTIETLIRMVNDNSAGKRAEEEGRQSEERYRSLFQNAVFGIFRSTPAGYFTDANPALCSMLGYDSIEELLEKGSTFDVYYNASERLAVLEELNQHDRIIGFDAVWKRKDEKAVTVRLSGRTVRNQQGEISAFEMLAEDVTYQLKDPIDNGNGQTLEGRTVNVEAAKSPASNEGPHPQKRGRW